MSHKHCINLAQSNPCTNNVRRMSILKIWECKQQSRQQGNEQIHLKAQLRWTLHRIVLFIAIFKCNYMLQNGGHIVSCMCMSFVSKRQAYFKFQYTYHHILWIMVHAFIYLKCRHAFGCPCFLRASVYWKILEMTFKQYTILENRKGIPPRGTQR